VPAAAVIPAPIAYAKIAVVEKLVVEFRSEKDGDFCVYSIWVTRKLYPLGYHCVGTKSLLEEVINIYAGSLHSFFLGFSDPRIDWLANSHNRILY